MGIPRNTINGDVDYWNAKIVTSSNIIDPEESVVINIQKFEIQQSRLRENLDKAENFQERQAIEKMIFDIEREITNTKIKLTNSMRRIHKLQIDYVNNWLKDKGVDLRYLTFLDTMSVSEKAQQRISKIIKEDRIKTGL